MKSLQEFINEELITEAFKSSIIKEFIEDTKSIAEKNQKLTTIEFYFPNDDYYTLTTVYQDGKLNIQYKPFFLGEIEDEDIYKNKIFSADECKKMLNINLDHYKKDLAEIASKKNLMFIFSSLRKSNSSDMELINIIFLEQSAFEKGSKIYNKIKNRAENKDVKDKLAEREKNDNYLTYSDQGTINSANKLLKEWQKDASQDQIDLLSDFLNWATKGETPVKRISKRTFGQHLDDPEFYNKLKKEGKLLDNLRDARAAMINWILKDKLNTKVFWYINASDQIKNAINDLHDKLINKN